MTDQPLPNLAFIRSRKRAYEDGVPACWDWDPTRPALSEAYAGFSPDTLALLGDGLILSSWQRGRCAVCGGREQVEDHDHETGYVRGLLCRSCNSMEGAAYRDYPVFENYRQRYPTLILGLKIRYINPLGHPTTRQEQRDWEQQVFGDKPSDSGDNAMRGVL